MIKEKYIQLRLARQLRGINTVEFIQSLATIRETKLVSVNQKEKTCI